MDTRLLRTFVCVQDTGSFTAAAQQLAFAQSTVSAHIQALEQELGVRLLDRLPTRAVLTTYGRRLLPLAQQMLELAGLARRIAGPDGGGSSVRLAAPDTLCGHRIPQAAAVLRRKRPDVQLSLTATGTSAALDALATGSADLVLVFESELNDVGQPVERIGEEPLSLICSPGHRLAGKRTTWQQLAEETFLLLEEGCSYSDAVARRLNLTISGRAKISRFGSADAVRACVAAGLGLSILPRITAEDSIRAGALATINLAGLPTPRVLLVTRAGHVNDPSIDTVAQALRAAFKGDQKVSKTAGATGGRGSRTGR